MLTPTAARSISFICHRRTHRSIGKWWSKCVCVCAWSTCACDWTMFVHLYWVGIDKVCLLWFAINADDDNNGNGSGCWMLAHWLLRQRHEIAIAMDLHAAAIVNEHNYTTAIEPKLHKLQYIFNANCIVCPCRPVVLDDIKRNSNSSSRTWICLSRITLHISCCCSLLSHLESF